MLVGLDYTECIPCRGDTISVFPRKGIFWVWHWISPDDEALILEPWGD